MEIQEVIKQLHTVCETINETHTLGICKTLRNITPYIEIYISKQLFKVYKKQLDNLYFEAVFNDHKYIITINETVYVISEIIIELKKQLLYNL